MTERDEMVALNEWMREPDYAENFTLADITDWINRRPIATVARLSAHTDEDAGYGVKPLEWTRETATAHVPETWRAKSICREYDIQRTGDGKFDLWADAGTALTVEDTLDEAKAAAQADYEQRIRSVITALPASDGDCMADFSPGDPANLQELMAGASPSDPTPPDYRTGCATSSYPDANDAAHSSPDPTPAEQREELRPGWLADDVAKASDRIAEWSTPAEQRGAIARHANEINTIALGGWSNHHDQDFGTKDDGHKLDCIREHADAILALSTRAGGWGDD